MNLNEMHWSAPMGGLVALVLIVLFNSLVRKRNQVDFAHSALDALFKQRHDLIPNLVSICEKYLGHERDLLAQLTAVRARASSPDPGQRAQAAEQMGLQLRSLMAVSESYPELRSHEPFMVLQRSLNEVESQIGAARRAYNAAVTAFNDAIQTIPTNLMARLMGYTARPLLQAQEHERATPAIWR